MISVEEALAYIARHRPAGLLQVLPLEKALGHRLAEGIYAEISKPRADVSAMDGYAVRLSDVREEKAVLNVIGEAAAGHPFSANVRAGEAVRVFTGSEIPQGADHVVIQEDAAAQGTTITVSDAYKSLEHVRLAGVDFASGDLLVEAGKRLNAFDLTTIAAGNHSEVSVYAPLKVAVLTSGDELRPPGSILGLGEIVNSNTAGLIALIGKWGGIPIDLGIAKDDLEMLASSIANAPENVDVFVAIGGASVGDYDFMRGAFASAGFEIVFEKVAVRPGKPTWFGKRGTQLVLGLPGNPASALVCAHLFLKTLVIGENTFAFKSAKTVEPMGANGSRETYVRAKAIVDEKANFVVQPYPRQDSSLIRPFLTSNCLIRRPPNAPAIEAGEIVELLMLD